MILLKSNSDVKHDGIFLTMEGSVNLQLSSKNVGIFEAFYNSVKVCVLHFLTSLSNRIEYKTCRTFIILRFYGNSSYLIIR